MNPIHNQNPLEKLTKAWPHLSPWQRKALLITVYIYVLRARLRALRPVDLLIPVALAQIAIFIYVAWLPSAQALSNAIVGNLVIAGMAMLPVTFSTPQRR